ncbi:MAG: hypothetical protein ACRD0U_13915, partial [Acidimicrobiales bacterium]
RGVAAYAGETISAALDLPRDRGQLPGAVAVGPDASIYLTIARAEAGSTEGVQVLLATESGGFEVVAGQGVGCTHSRTSASEAQFTSLTGVAVAADGTVYVADPRCGSVYSIAAGQVDVVLGGPDDPHAAIRMPVDVAMVGDDVYVADAGTGEVVRVGDGETVLAADEVPEGFEPDELQSLAATPDGDLVVAVRHRLLGVGLG